MLCSNVIESRYFVVVEKWKFSYSVALSIYLQHNVKVFRFLANTIAFLLSTGGTVRKFEILAKSVRWRVEFTLKYI